MGYCMDMRGIDASFKKENADKIINTIKEKSNKIKDNMELINKKKEKLDYTSKNSLPLFVNSIMAISVIKTLFRKKKKKGVLSKASDIVNIVTPLISIVK